MRNITLGEVIEVLKETIYVSRQLQMMDNDKSHHQMSFTHIHQLPNAYPGKQFPSSSLSGKSMTIEGHL